MRFSDILIRKLESIAILTDEHRAALGMIDGSVRTLQRGEDVAREGERPRESTLVLEGLLCRNKVLEGGKRQIMAFHTRRYAGPA